MRLIDADELKKDNVDYFDSMYGEDCADLFKAILNNAPTVDAEPVVHARWEPQHCESRGIFYICSKCEHGFKSITEHCPHCGTKMDKEEEK